MADRDIVIIPKNSSEELRLGLSHFRGYDLVSLRVFFEGRSGDWIPGKGGLALRIEQLPDLIEGLQKVEREARADGLLV